MGRAALLDLNFDPAAWGSRLGQGEQAPYSLSIRHH